MNLFKKLIAFFSNDQANVNLIFTISPKNYTRHNKKTMSITRKC